MRIVDYELFDVPPRWKFLKIETADGTVGWGEPTLNASDAKHGRTIETAVEELMDEFLVGSDPTRIEDHWERMYRRHYRGGPVLMTAISAIDQALWDIKGKQFGAPVYELLGGKARDRVRIYQHIVGNEADEMVSFAEQQVEDGFSSLKLTLRENYRRVDTQAKIRTTEELVSGIRSVIGEDVDLAIDFHGRSSKPMAKRIASALEPHNPMWFEEPVLPEYIDEMASIAEYTKIPLATGERMWSRWDFKEAFEKDAIGVAQPDVCHSGGITETKKIASMAEAYDVAVAPHMPYGPIGLAASLQIDGCTQNAFIQEQVVHRIDQAMEYLANPSALEHTDGFIELPDGPGIGIDVDEENVREAGRGYEPEAGLTGEFYWRYEDGSVADK